MSDKKFTIMMEILANTSVYTRAIRGAQRDIQMLGRVWNSTFGKLASVGVGFGVYKLLSDSAKLDKTLNQVALSAGKSSEEARILKHELEMLSIKTGQSTENLGDAFKTMASFTGSWDAAKESMSAINSAMTVTGASSEALARSLAVVSEAFHIDLKNPQAASDLLNKMAAMGKGAGGLSSVAGMFEQIALRANMAGMGANSALEFIGMIGKVTKNPEQMNLIAESTLKMFTNLRALSHMRGVKIFDEGGHQRDPLLILKEVGKAYEKLNDAGQMNLLNKLFNGDNRAMTGLQAVFNSGALDKLGELESALRNSGNGIENKLSSALDNPIDQAARLKNLMQEAAQGFVNPINKALANEIQFFMNKGFSGGDLGLMAGGATLLSAGAGMIFKNAFGNFLSGKAGVASGVAEGAALGKFGVQSVYVTNASEIRGAPGGLPGMLGGSLIFNPYTIGIVGMAVAAYLANKESTNRRLAEKGYNDRESDNLIDAATGRIYRPKLLKGDENYNLFNNAGFDEKMKAVHAQIASYARGTSKEQISADMKQMGIEIKQDAPTVNVYIDGNKVNGSKIISFERGKFQTQTVSENKH